MGQLATFRRKRNRLPRGAYIGQHWYFITLNAENRQPVLAGDDVAKTLLETLQTACAKHHFNIYAYCFMPDHVHVESLGLAPESDLSEFVRTWKGTSAAPLRELGLNDPLQKGFYDHILRPNDNQDAVAWYIFNNPVRKGLVKDSRDWPCSGSWMFDWKKAVAPPEQFVPPWKHKDGGVNPPLQNNGKMAR